MLFLAPAGFFPRCIIAIILITIMIRIYIQIKGVAHILSKTAGCSQIVCMIFIGMASETVRLVFIIIK